MEAEDLLPQNTQNLSDEEYKKQFRCFQCGTDLSDGKIEAVECANCGRYLCQTPTPCTYCSCEFVSRMLQ
jgi:hypothetical protein